MTPLISSIRYQGVMDNRTKLLPYKNNRCQLVLSLIRQSESFLLALYVKKLPVESIHPHIQLPIDYTPRPNYIRLYFNLFRGG